MPTTSIPVPATDPMLAPLLAVVPLQLLAYRSRAGAASTSTSRATSPRPSPSSDRADALRSLRAPSRRWVGLDLLEIERMERALAGAPASPRGSSAAGELAYAASAGAPGQHLAARFCAKEAVAKALGMRRLRCR